MRFINTKIMKYIKNKNKIINKNNNNNKIQSIINK